MYQCQQRTRANEAHNSDSEGVTCCKDKLQDLIKGLVMLPSCDSVAVLGLPPHRHLCRPAVADPVNAMFCYESSMECCARDKHSIVTV